MKSLLPQNVASSVRSLAKSMLGDKLKIEKQKSKVCEEQEKLNEMLTAIEDTDSLIKKKTGGYGFDELFDIRLVEVENDGKITKSNRLFLKYPETFLPSQPEELTELTEETEETESATTDQNSDFNF